MPGAGTGKKVGTQLLSMCCLQMQEGRKMQSLEGCSRLSFAETLQRKPTKNWVCQISHPLCYLEQGLGTQLPWDQQYLHSWQLSFGSCKWTVNSTSKKSHWGERAALETHLLADLLLAKVTLSWLCWWPEEWLWNRGELTVSSAIDVGEGPECGLIFKRQSLMPVLFITSPGPCCNSTSCSRKKYLL